MKIERKVLFKLPPTTGNSRNSEGDFITLPNGEIMFAYTRYESIDWDDHENSVLCALYSKDGEHFDLDNRKVIFDPKTVGGSNAMSVNLMYNEKGGISIYFIVKFDTHDLENKPVRDEIYRVDSIDGYDFSSEPILCFPKDHLGYHCINNASIVRVSNNRIIIPVSTHNMTFSDGKYRFNSCGRARFIYSDDNGYTFKEDVQVLTMPIPDSNSGLQEPGLVELPNGMLYGYFRTDADYQYESFSNDMGITWSSVKKSDFESPLSPMTVRRNPYSGKYYAIYNPYRDDPESIEHPRFRNTWGRTPLAIRESDDGLHFGELQLIEDNIHYGYCYTAIYFLNENEALVSYCSGGIDTVPLQQTTVSKISFNS